MISVSRKLLLLIISCVATFSIASAQRSNCSVAPTVNTIKQPDGSLITLVPFGNEAVHYLETSTGFTVLQNKDGFFEYAVQDIQGNLTLSGIIARDGAQEKTSAFTPHLRYSNAQQQALISMHNQLNENTGSLGKAGPYPFPSKGVRKVVVILVEYPDLRATIAKENFELLFNQPDYNGTGSFRDFYLATSHGQLDLTCTVYG